MFQSQFRLTHRENNAMKDFLIFVIRFYVKAWFTSTNAIEALNNDMQFLKKMYEYETIDNKLSAAVVKTFCNHLWYLSSECIAFSLFDPNVTIAGKMRMKQILLSTEQDDEIEKNNRLPMKQTQMSQFKEQNLSDFFTHHALKLFDRFELRITRFP